MLILAQLIQTPLQPGPVRLPEPAPIERRQEPKKEISPNQDKELLAPDPKSGDADAKQGARPRELPEVIGNSNYSKQQLEQIFAGCGRATTNETLQACAGALTARYVSDGYVNTRVYVNRSAQGGTLEVVDGTIAEIRINNQNQRFVNRVSRLLTPLRGSILHLPTLDRKLQQLRSWPGIGSVQGSLSRLGSDLSLAVLTLSVDQTAEPVKGEVSLRNDGNAGNGQWRAVSTILKNNLFTYGDTFLVYGEGDMSDAPQLGAVITSLSYAYPIAESVRLTGSFGYSRRNLIEGALAPFEYSFTQFQGYAQLEWVFKETLQQRWYAFGGLSLNRNNGFSATTTGSILLPFFFANTNTGFFRFGLGVNGISDRSSWSFNAYGLQGANGFSTEDQLQSMGRTGINPGQSTALGGSASLSYALSPNANLNLRGAGQYAFNPLINNMGFSLGSDTGLRGLPGQTISGDSGYLGAAEIAWTVWSKYGQSVQLVPFIGYGGITSIRYANGSTFLRNNSIGAGGIMARFLAGSNWQVEIGWVGQIDHLDQMDNAIWGNDYLLGKGLYTTIKYRF